MAPSKGVKPTVSNPDWKTTSARTFAEMPMPSAHITRNKYFTGYPQTLAALTQSLRESMAATLRVTAYSTARSQRSCAEAVEGSVGGIVYSGIVRACPAGLTCQAGSDTNWGPWSVHAGPGVTNFTVTNVP